jgi:hypothetical protein
MVKRAVLVVGERLGDVVRPPRLGDEPVVVGERGEAGRVRQAVMNRHGIGERRKVGEIFADGIVQVKEPALLELKNRDRGERLRRRPDSKERIGPRDGSTVTIGLAVGLAEDHLARASDGDVSAESVRLAPGSTETANVAIDRGRGDARFVVRG